MIRRPPRSTQSRSSAASDVYKRQHDGTGRRKVAGVRDVLEAVRSLGYGARVSGGGEGGATAMEASQVKLKGRFAASGGVLFIYFSLFFPIPFIFFALLFSLLVVTLIRGHIAGSFPPLPTTVRALHFYREKISALCSLVDSRRIKISALCSLVDSRRIVLTHARRSQQLILFFYYYC